VELVIASRNIHKIREFRAMLKQYKWLDLLSLLDFPSYIPPEEEGESFEEIASNKAIHAATVLERWVIADDSGLVVPSLSGAPGIYSARFAGPHATDAENRHKLLSDLRHVQEAHRQGYFECCIALASPQGLKKSVKGTCEGIITTEERGSKGFGYDPLFIKYEYGKTFAELEEDIKNRISHRRKALDKILITLEQLEKIAK
jgi:XTP/dITP diphosphohydrolase